ncbi:MAG: hypothetical protein ACTHL1_11585 [Burkholderiaceae bacterium]
MKRSLAMALLIACAAGSAGAADRGGQSGDASMKQDPARWYHEDMSPQARYQNAKKEAAAAQQEAIKGCREAHDMAAGTKACVKAAHDQYRQDLEYARANTSSR